MKINCLFCGFNIEVGDAYEDYEGQIRCYVCHALLEIKSQEGRLRSVRGAHPLPQGHSHQAGLAKGAAR